MTTPTASGPMIQTQDLRRTFKVRGKTEDIEAVRGVDLRVGAGEIFGFLGPNGAGKTTTLRMLATLLPPTSGEATVAGADLRREPQKVRERIGYVPQGGSTDPAETGRGELVIQGRLYGMDKTSAQRRAARSSRRSTSRRPPTGPSRTYSGGMKRRLDVGLGIVHRPAVLFLDEPTTGLDPQARARHVGRDPRPPRAGDDRLPDHPLPRGGRRAGRPAGDHRPRPDRGRGHGRRAQARGRRRRHHDRRRRRRRARPRGRPRPAVRARGEPARTALVRLYVDQGDDRGPAASSACSTAPGSRAQSLTLPAPASTTCSSARPADRSATTRRPDIAPNNERRSFDEDHARYLAHVPPLAHPDPAPAGLGRDGPVPAHPLSDPVRAAPRRRDLDGRRLRQRVQLVRPGPAHPDGLLRGVLRRLRAGRRDPLRRRRADAGDPDEPLRDARRVGRSGTSRSCSPSRRC